MSLDDLADIAIIALPLVILFSALLVFGGLEEVRRELKQAREARFGATPEPPNSE